jgi:hypothetical protein
MMRSIAFEETRNRTIRNDLCTYLLVIFCIVTLLDEQLRLDLERYIKEDFISTECNTPVHADTNQLEPLIEEEPDRGEESEVLFRSRQQNTRESFHEDRSSNEIFDLSSDELLQSSEWQQNGIEKYYQNDGMMIQDN